MIQRTVAEAIEASATAPDAVVSERGGLASVVGQFDRPVLDRWLACIVEARRAEWCRITVRDDLGTELDLAEQGVAALVGEQLRITVQAPRHGGALYVFTLRGLHDALGDAAALRRISVIRVASDIEPFATVAFPIEPWAEAPAPEPERHDAGPSPRRYTRGLSGSIQVPLEIAPWVRTERDAGLPAVELWQRAASNELLKSVASEIYDDDDGLTHVMLLSQPTRRMPLGELARFPLEHFATLEAAARWIYLEGTDVEVRHTLFVNELGRQWAEDEEFCSGAGIRLARASDAARTAYRAYLRDRSRDALKALADLRSALSDDIQKLAQHTRDLASSIWRDMAMAVAAFAVRFTLDLARLKTVQEGFAWVLLLIAAYIGLSHYATARTNRRFLEIMTEARSNWHDKVYNFVSDEEYTQLVTAPIRKATSAYNWIANRATFIVSALVIGLIILSFWELGWISYTAPRP